LSVVVHDDADDSVLTGLTVSTPALLHAAVQTIVDMKASDNIDFQSQSKSVLCLLMHEVFVVEAPQYMTNTGL